MYIHTCMYVLSVGVVIGTTAHTKYTWYVHARTSWLYTVYLCVCVCVCGWVWGCVGCVWGGYCADSGNEYCSVVTCSYLIEPVYVALQQETEWRDNTTP